MESRKLPHRKAREQPRVELPAENVVIAKIKKRKSPASEAAAKPNVDLSEGEEAPETQPVQKSRGKKAAAAKPNANLSEDDEGAVAEPIKKSKGKKDPEADAGPKKIKGKKAAATEAKEDEDAEEEPMKKSKRKKDPEGEPEAKKARGKKAASVEVKEDDGADEEPKKSKVKKAAKPNLNLSEDEEEPDEVPAKKSRGKKAAAVAKPNLNSSDDDEGAEVEPVKKSRSKKEPEAEAGAKKARGKRAAPAPAKEDDEEEKENDEAGDGPKKAKKLLNSVDTDYSGIDFSIKEKFNLKIVMWNVGGLRSLAKKNKDYFTREGADIVCMNEVKLGNVDEVPDEYKLDGYHQYWNVEKGLPGVGMLSKVEPIAVTLDLPGTEFADAKRLITAEYEKFFLLTAYVVNSGRGLKTLDSRLKWNEEFDKYVEGLDKKKPVIIAGDLNVSHQEIDLANPKANKNNAGFTQMERDGFGKLLSMGFVDTFRHFHPDETGAYTFWSYIGNARGKNIGWRLDYFVASKRLMKAQVKDSVIRSTVLGSDHCPIVLFLNL